jgi:hypothetical protein
LGVDVELTTKVLAALEREGVRYVVFGAVALAIHGVPRATEDLDLFVAPEHDNIHRLRVALNSVFHDPCIDDITADDLLGEYPAIQYVPPDGTFHLDILTRLGELYDFASLESERLIFDGTPVNVVTRRMLYRMKKATVRPKDWADAATIVDVFGPQED